MLRATFEPLSERRVAFHLSLPHTLQSAEIVLQIREETPSTLRASVGRYPKGTSAFPVSITVSRAHDTIGFSQKRLGTPPYDPQIAIVRFPVGTGGQAHAFLSTDGLLPKIEGAWIEGTYGSLPGPSAPLPLPSSGHAPRHALMEFIPPQER